MSDRSLERRAVVLGLGAALALSATATSAAATPAARPGPTLTASIVSDALRITNVVPTWGAQIPKVVFDGRWYYAATLEGNGSAYPWEARVWKSPDSKNWTLVATMPSHVYQPVGLLLDGFGKLHLQVACYSGASCYPGVAPAPGEDMAIVYPVRLSFQHKLSDGSFDFGRFNDHTVRSGQTARYYQGLAVSRDGRYIYNAYAVDNWDLYFTQFDTLTGQDVHTTKVGSPPAGRAWLYPRVQPGNGGSVYLSFSQYVLGSANSAYLDGAMLLRSTDRGLTFDGGYLTQNPSPDGNGNWVDASDITVDEDGIVHSVYYRRDNGASTLYYRRGMNGTPVAVGPLDNHSQILVDDAGRITVYSSEGADLVTASSGDGSTWTINRYTVPGVQSALWPNLVQKRSGSHTPPGKGVSMIMSGQLAGNPAFQPLLFVTLR